MSFDIATLGVNVDARQIQQGDRALDSFERTARRTDQTTERLNATQARLAASMKQLAAALAVAELIKYADTWANIEGRLRLVTTSTRELVQAQNDLFAISQRTRSQLEGTVDLYTRIKRTTAELATTDASRLRVTEAINKAGIISGASTQAQAAALLQLGQAFASNRLGGEELNSILEQTPRLAQAIAEGMGRNVGDLKKLGEQGKLTAEVVFGAILNSSKALDSEFEKMPRTVGQALTMIENAGLRAVGVFDQTNQLSRGLADALAGVADNIDTVAAALLGLGATGAARWLAGFLTDVYRSVGASNAAAAAVRSEAAARVAATVAVVDETAATVALTTARLAEVRAATLAATGETQLALVTNALIPAQARATAASAAHTAALSAQAAASGAAAGAGTLASRALGLLGGPIGIITTLLGLGVTAWSMWGNKAAEAETKAEATLAEKHVDIMKALNEQIDKLKERNRLMAIAPSVAGGNNQYEQHAAEILTEINRVAKDANLTDATRTEIMRVLGGQYNEATIALEAYRKEQDKLQSAQNGDKVQAWLDKHETYLSEAEKLAKEIKDAKKELGDAFTPDIEGRIRKNFADKAGKGAANEFKQKKKEAEEYIATLQRETEQLGATEQQQYMLEAAQKASHAPTVALRARILELALAYTIEKERQDELAAAKKRDEEARKAHVDAMVQELQTGANAVTQLQKEVDTYGMGAAAVTRYNMAKLETRKAILQANEGSAEEIAQVEALIKQQEKLLGLQNQRGDLDSLFDTAKVESFGDALRNAFGEAGNSLAQLTNALQDYVEKQQAADKERSKIRLKYAGDEARTAKEIAKVDDKLEKSRVDSYATMAGAAKGFFKEGSKGYKLLETTERAFRAFELAQAAGNLAKKLLFTEVETTAKVSAIATETAANVASVAPNVAADGAKATASGVAAFAKTLASLPFPANIAAGAAVIGLLAAVGVKLAGGGGGGKSISQSRQEQQGTGSVLGDASAKSESISKALEELQKNSNVALEYSSESLAALRSIDNGIAAFAARAAGMSGLTGKTAGSTNGAAENFVNSTAGTALLGGVIGVAINKLTGGLASKVLGKIAGSIFGGKTSVEDTGFTLGKGSLGALNAGGVQASQYQDVLKKGGWFSSDKRSTNLSSLGSEANDDFTRILKGITRAVTLSAESLGMAGTDFKAKLDGFVVDIGKISLKDMKGDEIEKAIQAVFSKLGDDIAKYAVGGLEGFQQAGEGYLETLVRVASGVERAQFELDRFGLKSVALADIQEKQGDVAAELVRQTILAHESLQGVADIMRTLDGTASDLADTYEQLKQVQQQLVNVGIDPATLGRQLIGGARDLSGLGDALETYFDKFFTESEKAAAKTAELTAKFKALGFELPKSNEEYRKLLESIPKTTAEGQTLTGKLLLLAEAVAELNESTGKATDAVDLANQRRELELQILEATGRSAQALAIKRQMELAAMDESLRGLQLWLYALQDTKQAAEDAFSALQRSVAAEKKAREAAHNSQMAAFDSAIKSGQESISRLQQLSQTLRNSLNNLKLAGAAVGDRAAAQATLRRAISGGVDSTDLQNALSTVGQDAGGQFMNRTDYLRDFYKTKISISELSTQTDDQLSAAEKQVEILQELKAAEQARYEAEIAALDRQLAQAQAQLDALNQINTSVLTIPEALNQFAAAIQAAQAAQAGALGAIGGGAGPGNIGIGGGTGATWPGGVPAVKNPLTSWWEGGDFDYWKNVREGRNGLPPGFASGGRHSGGWRMVGETGPELEYTGPSHIMSNGDTQDLMNNAPVVAALNEMRQENREMLYAIAKNTMNTDKTLKRWDYNGQPETREQ